MIAAITLGNVLVVDRQIMTPETHQLADVIREYKLLIHTALMNLWVSITRSNPEKDIKKPSLWVMYLGPREQVIQFTSPDSEKEIFMQQHDITPPFREFWKVIEDADYRPEVRCAKLLGKAGAFLLLSEAT